MRLLFVYHVYVVYLTFLGAESCLLWRLNFHTLSLLNVIFCAIFLLCAVALPLWDQSINHVYVVLYSIAIYSARHVHACALALLEGNSTGFAVKLAIIVQFKTESTSSLQSWWMRQTTRQKQDTIEQSMASFKGYGCYFVDTALPPGIANPSNSILQCLLNSSPFPPLLDNLQKTSHTCNSDTMVRNTHTRKIINFWTRKRHTWAREPRYFRRGRGQRWWQRSSP